MKDKDYKKEFYEYGESIGIESGELHKLMELANYANVESSSNAPKSVISKGQIKIGASLTVGRLKKYLEESGLPDDGIVLVQRVEDKYFNGIDISGMSGCEETEDGIYPPGSKSSGWGVYLKEGDGFYRVMSMNKRMREEILRRERGKEAEYPEIEDPNKYICEDEEFLNNLKEQYISAFCYVIYDDEDHLFINLHY